MSQDTQKFSTIEQFFVSLLSFVFASVVVFAIFCLSWILILTSYHAVVTVFSKFFGLNLSF